MIGAVALDRLTRHGGRRLVRLAVRGLAIGWIVSWWLWLQSVQHEFIETDAQAYWGFDLERLYAGVALGDTGAFLYSPVVAQLFAPLSALPYDVFYALLAAVNLGALVWLVGVKLAAVLLFVTPVSNEIARGNIHLLMAVAIVVGFRYPAAWAWILLTKVTPGVGLVWFAARREWRKLGTALLATAALVVISVLTVPELWSAWIAMLAADPGSTRPGTVLQLPAPVRIVAAAAVTILGARLNRPALVPVAALLALPAIWINALALLVAVIPIWRDPVRTIGLSNSDRPSVQ